MLGWGRYCICDSLQHTNFLRVQSSLAGSLQIQRRPVLFSSSSLFALNLLAAQDCTFNCPAEVGASYMARNWVKLSPPVSCKLNDGSGCFG
jgi:hypothetical protein